MSADRSAKQNTHTELIIWLALLGEGFREFFRQNGVIIPPREALAYYVGFLERGKNRRDSRPLYGEVHEASRHILGKISLILSAEIPDDDETVAATLMRLLAQASTSPGPGYKKALDENLIRLGMTLPARHSIPDAGIPEKAPDAIKAALKAVGDRPKAKLTIPVQVRVPQTGRLHRLVCAGGTPTNKCGFEGVRIAEHSPGRVFIGCIYHGGSTLRLWPKDAPDPRDEPPAAERLPEAAE